MAYSSISTCISDLVVKNSSEETIVLAPQPSGMRVRILGFGGSGLGKAGSKPAVIRLLWGAELIREFGLTGVAFESAMDRLLVSTGIESLKIVRVNDDASDQGIAAWLEGYTLG